jgi:2-phosphosulfolactate phosphatase
MNKTVIIDAFPESAKKYLQDHAIVVIDVIRATTTATTAVSFGRRVFPVQTTDEAFILSDKLQNANLVGELGGNVPYGFHLTNSPVQVAALELIPCGMLSEKERPIILLSSSGTQLLLNAKGAAAVYLACFRNFSAVANHLSGKYNRIAILGAGTRGQFRREDQIGCAWVAEKLMARGYTPEDASTSEVITRWHDAKPALIVPKGRSADYLRRSGQVPDLEFIINHIDDLNIVPEFSNGEIVKADEPM